MRWHGKLAVVAVAAIAGVANHPLRAQGVDKYFAPQDQVIAIRAGQLLSLPTSSLSLETSCRRDRNGTRQV